MKKRVLYIPAVTVDDTKKKQTHTQVAAAHPAFTYIQSLKSGTTFTVDITLDVHVLDRARCFRLKVNDLTAQT